MFSATVQGSSAGSILEALRDRARSRDAWHEHGPRASFLSQALRRRVENGLVFCGRWEKTIRGFRASKQTGFSKTVFPGDGLSHTRSEWLKRPLFAFQFAIERSASVSLGSRPRCNVIPRFTATAKGGSYTYSATREKN